MTDSSPLQSVPDADHNDGPPASPIDLEKIERAVRDILEAIGEDPERDGLVQAVLGHAG